MRFIRATETTIPSATGERAAGETGARAAGDERNSVTRAEPQHALHVLRRAGKDDARGLRAPPGETVAVVGREAAPAR